MSQPLPCAAVALSVAGPAAGPDERWRAACVMYGIEARSFFGARPWTEVEPIISQTWERMHARELDAPWEAVAADVHAAWSYVPGTKQD